VFRVPDEIVFSEEDTIHVPAAHTAGSRGNDNIIVSSQGECQFADSIVVAMSPDRTHAFYFVRTGDQIVVLDDLAGQSSRRNEREFLNSIKVILALQNSADLEAFKKHIANGREERMPVQRDSLGVVANHLPSLHMGHDFVTAQKTTTSRMKFATQFADRLDEAFEKSLGISVNAIISNPLARNPVVATIPVNATVLATAYRPYVGREAVVADENAKRTSYAANHNAKPQLLI
jgi:hypothetical protein